MCGRFSLQASEEELVGRYGVKWGIIKGHLTKKEEVFPSEKILYIEKNKISVADWGIKVDFLPQGIINSRLENIYFSKFFLRDFEESRVLIPATSFFEWDQSRPSHDKYKISAKQPIFSFAGLKRSGDNIGVSILTKEAEGKMKEIHPRVPVILPISYEKDYLFSKETLKVWKSLMEIQVDLYFDNTSPSQLSFL